MWSLISSILAVALPLILGATLLVSLGILAASRLKHFATDGGDDAEPGPTIPMRRRRLRAEAAAARTGYLAQAHLVPTGNSPAHGSVTFALRSGALRIHAHVDHAAIGLYRLVVGDDRCGPLVLDVDAGGSADLVLYLHPSAYSEDERESWQALPGMPVSLYESLPGRAGACRVAAGVLVRHLRAPTACGR